MTTSILIFGGTFDPPHRAHVELPRFVADRLACERIIYVPTSSNPLKEDSPTPARHRLAMLDLALVGQSHCTISTLEIDREGPSYTVDTLEALRERFGDHEIRFRLLMGADAAVSFCEWKSPERILELATPVVMLRPPYDRERFREELMKIHPKEEAERWLEWTIDCPKIDISASALREKLARAEDVSDAIDPLVMEYIREHGLYRDAS